MHIQCLQHVPFETPGSIGGWACKGGHSLAVTALYHGHPLPELASLDLLVVLGGPMNIYEEQRFPWLRAEKRFIAKAVAARKSVLGICLGAQLIADVLGARVFANRYREIGWFPIEKTTAAQADLTAAFLPQRAEVFHWHGDTFELPAGALHLARSRGCEQQGFVFAQRVVGLQFHLETLPELAAGLIAHCGAEIVPGPYVQSPEQMIADPARFGRINRVMQGLLDQLAILSP
jgi:GMP synthase (glutamine-hydrolysing)